MLKWGGRGVVGWRSCSIFIYNFKIFELRNLIPGSKRLFIRWSFLSLSFFSFLIKFPFPNKQCIYHYRWLSHFQLQFYTIFSQHFNVPWTLRNFEFFKFSVIRFSDGCRRKIPDFIVSCCVFFWVLLFLFSFENIIHINTLSLK